MPERRISAINKKYNDGNLCLTDIPPLSIITGRAIIRCKNIKNPHIYIRYLAFMSPREEAL